MNASLERLRERFESDPTDAAAFEALEEAHFVSGEWNQLVALYERRLGAADLTADAHAKARARVMLRLGQVLQERCLQLDTAVDRYQEAVRLDPTLRPALVQLRTIYAERGQWDMLLQIAEIEAELPMRPFERAAFASELGEVWHQRLGDASQAIVHFERALSEQPDHSGALLGAAAAYESLEQPEKAKDSLERAIETLRGTERAPALVSLARLNEGPLGEPERATELYHRALSDDARNEAAIEAMADRARADERYDLFEELSERRFHLAAGAVKRLAIAHEAGRVHLEHMRNPQGARHWFARALDLFPEDPVVHLALADVERASGNTAALASHLKRAAELAVDAAPVEVLVESAELAAADGDQTLAVTQLRRALARRPGDEDLTARLSAALEQTGRDDDMVSILAQQTELTPSGTPERAEALTRLGKAYEERMGDHEQALDAYRQAAEAAPEDPAVQDLLEGAYRKADDPEALRAHLEQAIERAPRDRDSAPLHCELGDLLIERFEDLEGAKECYAAAIALDEGHERARQGLERVNLALGDDEAVLDAFEHEARQTTDRDRLTFLAWELVRIHLEAGRRDRALHWVEQLVEAAPDDLRALETCAKLQEDLGIQTGLAQTLERMDVLLSGKDQARNRRRMGEVHASSGSMERAIAAFKSALETDPDDGESLLGLVGPLEAAERWSELVEARRHLAELLPEDQRPAAMYEIGVLIMDRLEDPEGAVAIFEGLQDQPGLPDDVDERFEGLLERTRRFDALESRLRARRTRLGADDPAGFALDLRRADLLLEKLHRPAEAASLYRAVHESDPDSSAAARGLENSLRQSNDTDGLVSLLERQSARETDEDERARLDLERALMLEDDLERLPETRRLLAQVADGESAVAADAERHLRSLLERSGDFDALRDRLVARVDAGTPEEQVERRVELAALCRDRLRDLPGATEHLEAAVALDRNRPDAWQSLARLYQDQERSEEWVEALEGELGTEPVEARAIVLHGRAAELCMDPLGDLLRAAQHFESVLELDPNHALAADFLAYHYDAEGRHAELAQVLERQLSDLQQQIDQGDDASLRLRVAALRSGPLEDLDGAIDVLEPAARGKALSVVAEPLAELYEKAERADDLVSLCRSALEGSRIAGERANWSLRLADALRTSGQHASAAEAYRQVLADRPDDQAAQSALRDLYRRLGEAEPLVRLLDAQLARVGGEEEIPIRMELAGLLAERLDRRADALVHLRRVLEIEPAHAQALEQALGLAEALELAADALELVEIAIGQTHNPAGQARLLVRRAQLLAGPLARTREAAGSLREALDLDPSLPEVRRELRRILTTLGDWRGVLECIEQESSALGPDETEARADLYEHAAGLAETHLGPDASLPWLERLRSVRPSDGAVLDRIADVHREADRTTALLSALEEAVAVAPDPARRVELERERAQIFERKLSAPTRAIAAMQAAREADPESVPVLRELDRLCDKYGRERERAEILDTLIDRLPLDERRPLRRVAIRVHQNLARPDRAADQAWKALAEDSGTAADRAELLACLCGALREAGRQDLWARAAEAELASLDPGAPVFAERRRELRFELARAYGEELARPDAAASHLRTLLDLELDGPDGESALLFDRAEEALLATLRRRRNPVELERRLATRLARTRAEKRENQTDQWIELGRLRCEQLYQPGAAAEAFEEVLERDPSCVDAVRGLRAVAEQLGQAERVAGTLERELELMTEASASERAGLYRKLGEVSWKALDSTTKASRAFAAALEADPSDLGSLRSLSTLFETMEDWRGALDLYESEASVLGEEDPERRQEIWLRVGRLARTRENNPTRALRAYEAAAALGPISREHQLEWAELYDELDQPQSFVDVFGSWCDDNSAEVGVADHLRLAAALEELCRDEEALERTERALELNPVNASAWDGAARIRERLGRTRQAAEALDKAATRLSGQQAASRRLRAAELMQKTDADWSLELLERAVEDDPAHAGAQARLASVAASMNRLAQAERAAERALVLSASGDDLARDERLDTALIGARAARALEHLQTAARLFEEVLAIEPDHAEALAALGEVLMELGEPDAARKVLEARLDQEGINPNRAQQLTLLARAQESAGEVELALERYAEAVNLDPLLDDAQRGRVSLLERMERSSDAVDALQGWAAKANDPSVRAERLLRAAEIELTCEDRAEAAEELLREATSAAPDCSRAWALLCELLVERDRETEALEISTRALDVMGEGEDCARVAVVRGRMLEKQGDRRQAAEAFRTAITADPRCSEAGLSGARLLRGLGDWRGAADLLRSFVDNAPPDAASMALALHQLGRLLAGPLEDVDGAIRVYRRALETDPSLEEAHEALAELLVHRPNDWEEAIQRHRELLEEHPARTASLRSLLGIAREKKSNVAVANGLCLLRALGAATPGECEDAPNRPRFSSGSDAGLPTRIWEIARRVAQEASLEIGEALGAGSPAGAGAAESSDPVARFRAAVVKAEGDLSAPGLVPLSTQDLGEAITLVAKLCSDAEAVSGDGNLVNALSRTLNRRARKRVKKALGEVPTDGISRIDWEEWRKALRGLASTQALESSHTDLRSAFLAWIQGDERDRSLPEGADISDLVEQSPEAAALLRQLTATWIASL